MENKSAIDRTTRNNESGVALATVIFISVLLLTAIVALLSAASNHTKNVTDVLSETKAYYAAESGLQATVNALRNDATVTYKYADSNQTLSAKLPYNYPIGSPDRAVIGQAANTYDPKSGTAYSVRVEDPDNTSESLTFYTSGTFKSYNGAGGVSYSTDKKTIYLCATAPCNMATPRTEITFTDATSTTTNFSGSNPRLGSFSLVQGGVPLTGKIEFFIDYKLTFPRTKTERIWGSITQASSSSPVMVTFLSQVYTPLGGIIELCSVTSGGPNCADVSLNLSTLSPSPSTFYGYITAIEPYRLRVVSTGYGPNGARKQLEAFVQNDLLDGLESGAATTMLGTYSTPPGGLPFLFDPGSSNGITYSGGDCASSAGCVPSFGLTDPGGLDYVLTHPPGPGAGDPNQMLPAPQLLDSGNLPDWQQSPQNLEILIDKLRTTAQNSGRYFVNPSGDQDNFGVGTNASPPGSLANGTGITFCEGSCKIGASGGGILVVTGKLTNVGSFSFNGIIIVTGEEGWERNGGGNGQITGNVIIAPYNMRSYIPANNSYSFLAPRYYITGGGSSDVIYNDIAGDTLSDTKQISNFVLGVAEK